VLQQLQEPRLGQPQVPQRKIRRLSKQKNLSLSSSSDDATKRLKRAKSWPAIWM